MAFSSGAGDLLLGILAQPKSQQQLEVALYLLCFVFHFDLDAISTIRDVISVFTGLLVDRWKVEVRSEL